MALIRTGAAPVSAPTFTTFDKATGATVTDLTIGKKYIFNVVAGNSDVTLTGATIIYQDRSTGAAGSYYPQTVIAEATATSVTISGTGLGSAKLVTAID